MNSPLALPHTETRTGLTGNAFQKILRVREHGETIGPLRLADPGAHSRIFEQICRNLATGELLGTDILLTTGIGLPAKNLSCPMRLPALLLPGLQMMRSFKKHGMEPPQYLVYQATDFISHSNEIDPASARKLGKQMEHYLQKCIDELYPDIASSVVLEFGCEFSPSVKESIDRIARIIREKVSSIPDVGQAISSLRTAENNHSNGNGKLYDYAAANVLYNGSARPEYPFDFDPKVTLVIGGKAEAPFFSLMSHFPNASEQKPVIPLFTHLGSRPTYYPYPEKGDPMSPDEYGRVIATPPADGPISHDLDALLAAGLTSEKLRKILSI